MKSRARAENGKPQFPGARGPKIEKKTDCAIRDGCPQLFYVLRLARPDPRGGKSQNTGILGPFDLGRPLNSEKSRGLAQNGKMQFPGARGTFGGKIRQPKGFPRNCAFFLHCMFWLTGPPPAGNREIRGFLGHCGPGQLLVLT